MKLSEDLTLSIRALYSSPIESMLLIIGLALSIGATASGIAMYEKAQREGTEMLRLPEYREIVVSSSESREEMDRPLTLSITDEAVQLSIGDLEAKAISPAIEHAYLENRTRLRLNTSAALERHEQREQEETNRAPSDAVQATPEGQSAEEKPAAQPNENQPPEIDFAAVEGPEPTVDELSGYEVTAEFFSAMNMQATSGSLFTPQDLAKGRKVLVLGSTLANTLFEDGISIERQIASFDRIYTIIGVMAPTGSDYDLMAFIPSQLAGTSTGAQAARGPFGGNNTSLHFAVEDSEQLNNAENQLVSWFDSQYGQGQINISVPREEAQALIARNEKIAVITMVLALAGLLIASVNVSNILYSRTLRRRKQIGILKALGATRLNIFQLFFSEGALLLVIGAILGLGVVTIFSMLMNTGSGSGSLPVDAVLIGMIASSFITLCFTLVPALQASKVPPAEAMRVE